MFRLCLQKQTNGHRAFASHFSRIRVGMPLEMSAAASKYALAPPQVGIAGGWKTLPKQSGAQDGPHGCRQLALGVRLASRGPNQSDERHLPKGFLMCALAWFLRGSLCFWPLAPTLGYYK